MTRPVIAEHRAAHLVVTSGRGHVESLAELYDGMAERVFAAGYLATGRLSAAEDIACEVMHRVWQQAPSFESTEQDAHQWIADLLDQALQLRRLDQGASASPVDLTSLPPLQKDCLERVWLRGEAVREIACNLRLQVAEVARSLNDGLRSLAR